MSKKVAVIIPARMAASRFPGKPLSRILDLPMIEHVRRRVLLSDAVDEVYVATCDHEIMDTVHRYGGKAIMTASTHERCTDRVEEAAHGVDADIIVMIQGDEPLFMPGVIRQLIDPFFSDPSVNCTNLISLIRDRNDLNDVDIVKAAVNLQGNIMFFSRAPIPYFRVDNHAPCYRQTGVSAFSRSFLSTFTALSPTQLEVAESVDFLRILEHGFSIRSVIINDETHGVDRPDDVAVVEHVLRTDPVQREYYERILSL
ncbi:MAG: 3-deoxy-manno-octulosonate cytidylyltransferase [Methanoregula sp.]|nr:MAG: 3-deoxy-manno-octulosonate cytidylyltransferase [Methanoregula sp.]